MCIYLPTNTSYMQHLDQSNIHCVKHAQKHLVQYYFQKMERNVHVNEIREWNVTDAIRSVTVASELYL
jgi:hypothetical protein